MDRATKTETIVAPITGSFGGAVQLIRISGPDTIRALEALIVNSDPVIETPRKLFLREFISKNKKPLDEGLVAYFKGPSSYTGEDVAEFHLHASPYIVRTFIETLNSLGIKNAKAGEFTQRAFLNGKLDLSQAEAVSDIVLAETESQAKVAKEQLSGRLSEAVSKLGEPLRDLLAEIEAYIDFPDEDIELSKSDAWLQVLAQSSLDLGNYIGTYQQGKICRDGAQVVLAGLPNAGKSSLMNALVGSERAIVTSIAGTTRDTIEERISINGIFVHLWDTAGFVSSDDKSRTINEVERKGVELSWQKMVDADVVLFIFDPEQDLAMQTSFLKEVESKTSGQLIQVVNKSDMQTKNFLSNADTLHVSAKTLDSLDKLKGSIADVISKDVDKSTLLICNARHLHALKECEESVEKAMVSIKDSNPAEFISFDIRQSLNALVEIVGVSPTEDILGRIFSKFCIGK